MIDSKLDICENCRFYFFLEPYVEIDLFMNQQKRKGGRYCKWFGKRIKKKSPACGVFKKFGR